MHKFLLLLLLVSCGIDRTTNSISSKETGIFNEYLKLDDSHQLQIASKDELGERLTLCLTFIDKASEKPVKNRKIHFYHTDTHGNYDPVISSDESTARLSGSALTNHEGRSLVETILPGDYGSSSDNRHIHTNVTGASPEAYDIHFKQFTSMMGKRFVSGSDQHFLADLKRNADGSYIGFVTIAVKNP